MRRTPERGRAAKLNLRLAAQRKTRRSGEAEDVALADWRRMTAGVAHWTRFNAGVGAAADDGRALGVLETREDRGSLRSRLAETATRAPVYAAGARDAAGREVSFVRRPQMAERSLTNAEAPTERRAGAEAPTNASRRAAQRQGRRAARGVEELPASISSVAQPSPSDVGPAVTSTTGSLTGPMRATRGPDLVESAPAWGPLPTAAPAPGGVPSRPGVGGRPPWND
jgi:hypothetical protein